MVGKKGSGKYVKFVAYLVVIVLVNIAGITLFLRLDLTSNKLYSISKASQKVVATLSEPLTIKVFFTKDLPAPHNNTERYLHDLLLEYAIYANKNFNYSFYDVSPEEGETTEETKENQKIASNYGIQPIQIQAVEKDEIKFQRAYMGLVMIHGDLIERIPTITTTQGLEYKLTTSIQKMNNKISALLSLPDKISIKLFLTSSMETVAPYMGIRKMDAVPDEVESLVKRLNQKHYGKLAYEFINPASEQEIQAATKKYNIMALSWPALSNGKIPPGQGAIGIAMEYGDRVLAVPFMNVMRIPIIGTQYKLTEMNELESMIEKNIEGLIDVNEELGYLADHGTLQLSPAPPSAPGQPRPEPANNFRTLVSRTYSLKNINLKEDGIPESLNNLIIVRPTQKFNDYELYQIDQFLMRGKSLFLVIDRFNEIMPQTPQGMSLGGQGPQYVPLNTGLDKLLTHYGVRIKRSYVMDENCFRQQMPQQFGGGERAIYFAPVIKNQNINKDLDFMNNIKGMVALKISPLELITEHITAAKLSTHELFASSEKSWEMRDRINLNPLFIQPPSSTDDMQSKVLAYLVEGEFPSYFDGKPIPIKEVEKEADKETDPQSDKQADAEKSGGNTESKPEADLSKIESKGQFRARGKPGKIIVMASADMLKDNVLDDEGKGANAIFVMNAIDYLNNREDIAIMRSKEQRFNPLDDTAAGTKTFVKTFNIAGLPILVVLFGLAIWLRRVSRKKHIQMMFQK